MADAEDQPPVDQPTEETPAVNIAEDQAENNAETVEQPDAEQPDAKQPDAEQPDAEQPDAEPPNDTQEEEQPAADAAPAADTEAKPDEEGEVKDSQLEAAEVELSEAKPEGEEGQIAPEQEDGVKEDQPAEGDAQPQADGEGEAQPAEGEDGNPPADENAEEATTEVKESAGDEEAASGEAEQAGESPPKDEDEDVEAAEKTEEQPEEAEASAEPAGDDLEGLPKSDTFADGEKPESPAPHVGEVLSREGSPKPAAEEEHAFTPPVPESPREEAEGDGTFDVQDLEEEIISPEQDRETLVEMYHQAIAEREQFQQQNHQLQHKLAEYFKKKKSDEQKSEAVDKNEADQEQRYLKYMSQLEELRAEDQQIRETFAIEIEELHRRCEEKQEEVEAHRAQFVEFKHQVALNALNSRSGKPIQPKDIESYLSGENRKDQEVVAVRLENIKLKNKLKKKEQQLKSKEELADGLHLIDFEQLKIENQTYNEKIEERNEELLKLRKKITNTVQVLTHLKEKLQYVQGENNLLKNKLKDVESSVAQKRDVLTRTKQARDALRIDNHKLRQNCGLLGNEPLLRDFEERKDEADNLRERLERLKMQHAELTLNSATVRRKIAQIKAVE